MASVKPWGPPNRFHDRVFVLRLTHHERRVALRPAPLDLPFVLSLSKAKAVSAVMKLLLEWLAAGITRISLVPVIDALLAILPTEVYLVIHTPMREID